MRNNLKRFATLLVFAGLLASCASGLSLYDRKNMSHWREADRLVGKHLRWSDVWCEIASKDRQQFTIQKSSDSEWELANMQFPRDTVVTRRLIMNGEVIYPTTFYKVIK